MVAFQSKKSKAKLLAGGVIKPEQVTTGVIEAETVASGAMVPISTGGGVISGGDTPPTPVVMYTFTINPTPADAVVKINGAVRNSITARENTTIKWEVSRSGYITQTGSETLTANMTKEISLVAIPTYTFAISPVPVDAEVIINGEAVNSVTVETGTTVDWSVSKTGYISQSGSEIVTADVTKEIELAKIKVQFTVNASPDNAVVKINGVQQSSIEVDYGSTVTWEVSADGYITQSGTTEALTENTSLDIALEVVKYTFTINPTPTDAVVTINGTITNSVTVNVGTVIDWSVEAEGYTPQSGNLTLTENTTLDVTLAEIVPEYTFTINPTPADAVVTINDVQQSSITVEAGTAITWSVSAEGYTSQSGELTLTENTTLNVVLEVASSWTYTGNSAADNVTVSAVPDSSIFDTSTRTPEEIYSGEYNVYFAERKRPASNYVSIKFPQPMNLKSISVDVTNEVGKNSDYYNYIGLFKDGSAVTEIGYTDSKLNPEHPHTYTGAIDFNAVCDEIRLGNRVYNRSYKVFFKITDIQADYA